jgi:hypothetical protein
MEHGLMLAMWLTAACLLGIALWRTGGLKKVWDQPIGLWVGLLLFTFINMRSTGAYGLFLLGVIIMVVGWKFRNTLIAWILIGGICLYLYTGAMGTFPAKEIVVGLKQMMPEDRVSSLEFRFNNEELLGAKARQRFLYGWGGFGRNRIFNEIGEDVSVTDSLWIITFGINGAFGLVTLFASLILPSAAFLIRIPTKLWTKPSVAPAAMLAIVILLYMFDCVLNAMVNPLFMLAAGGLTGTVIQPKQVVAAELNPAPRRKLAAGGV